MAKIAPARRKAVGCCGSEGRQLKDERIWRGKARCVHQRASMGNTRLRRLEIAKRVLEIDPELTPDQVMKVVQLNEKRARPDPFKSIGKLLEGFQCKRK